jgi:hypothetical protein
MVTPIVSSKYRHLYQFCYVKIFSTDHNGNLLLLDDPVILPADLKQETVE